MNVERVIEKLGSIAESLGDQASFGMRGDAAYLRVLSGNRWCVVWTPGDRWFSLDIDGGYSVTRFDEDPTDSEAEQMIQRLVNIGLTYLRGDYDIVHSQVLKIPKVVVIGFEDAVLTLSVGDALSHTLGFKRRSRPRKDRSADV